MSPRTGRPIVGSEPKDQRITIRTTATAVKKLAECSAVTGKTKTDLIEEMIDSHHDSLTKK